MCGPVIATSHTELVTCVEDRKTPSIETLPEAGHLFRNVGSVFAFLCMDAGRTLEEPDEKSTSHKTGKVEHDTYVC